ncbi:Putative macrophage migration inhibitory factor, Tautomerase/MIF superfamily [Septoria linicola]|uniref:L-dopachrome isomerase n=1 Tax=Septoria linicola TaxID=215465 RepID=A0A9Q9AKT7_9PEZI|nr:putative macrophage migration inhibitory factor, Tautomerase/MIF superfamily [Septoria linicola]USW49794.1 Putative macrophage migration inhibitory factor, Tautomerase/MIF superfamily [Septoria linicola]
MPHSNKGSADAHSTFSLDSLGQVTTASSSKPTDVSSLSEKFIVAPSPAIARDRSSLPAELAGSIDFSDFMHKQLEPRDSVMASYNSSSRQRTQYYDEQFQYKDGTNGTIRERVHRDSPIVVELRTNVIIKDEFTLVTDLSYHLAARYTRPDSAVMVKVDHSACLAMGGTFEPCYIMSITAESSQMGPTMNKRNAALIQSFLADILSVPPERGVLKFVPIPEENFATNGTTMLGKIERQEKRYSGENSGGVRRAMNSMGRKSMPSFKKSISKINGEEKPETESKPAAMEPRPTTARTDSAAPSNISEDQQETPTQMSATITSPGEVYELPATEMEKERPVTAHKRKSSSGTSGASNGLRMNGVSNGALGPVKSTTPKVAKKSRPRTFSGESLSVQDQIKSKSISLTTAAAAGRAPVHLSAAPSSKKERPPSFLKHDPLNTVSKASPNNTSRPTTPRQKQSGTSPAIRPRDSLHNSIIDTHSTPKPLNGWTNESAQEKSRRKIEKLTGENPLDEKKDTEANTAKRRSTITATPKFPEPPPIPVDRQDSKSLKVGKRKSFLSAFKRTTPLAQPAR